MPADDDVWGTRGRKPTEAVVRTKMDAVLLNFVRLSERAGMTSNPVPLAVGAYWVFRVLAVGTMAKEGAAPARIRHIRSKRKQKARSLGKLKKGGTPLNGT